LEDVIVLTVVVFTVVITTLSSLWDSVAFWKNLAILFTVHAALMALILHILPPRRFGIPKLLLTAGGVAEIFLIGTLVYRKATDGRNHKL